MMSVLLRLLCAYKATKLKKIYLTERDHKSRVFMGLGKDK